MKVLCIYPNCEGYGRVPIGFSLILSCLLREGHNVELFDTTFIGERGHVDDDIRRAAGWVLPVDISHLYQPHTIEEIDEMLRKQVQRFSPDLIAVTIIEDNYPYADHLLSVVKTIGDIPVIAGGSTPSSVPAIVIDNPHIDYVCQGEGEEAMVEVCDLMSGGKSVENVPNLWYKKNGVIKHNPQRPFIDMNTLPIQRLELWDKRHHLKPYTGKLRTSGYFEVSRGCPRKCSYCINQCLQISQRNCGRFHREKSIENVIKEIKMLKEQYCFEMIFFADDNLLLMSQARLDQFTHAWMSEIKLPYWMETVLELITAERLAKLKESGCCGISIGLESGNEWIRSNVLHRKYMDNDHIVARFKLIASFGIRLTVNSIIGSVGEYEDDIFETIKLLKRINPKSISVSFMAPFAGTAIHATAKERGYLDVYTNPGFTGMAKNISVREGTVMKLPQISNKRLKEIFYKFSDYVYGNIEIPEQFHKPAPGAHRGAPPRDSDGREIITVKQLRNVSCQPLSAKADSLSLPHQGRDNRLVDESPVSDVKRSYQVSVRGKSADLANEGGLRLTIGFRNKTTTRTRLRGIFGVNQLYQHPSQLSLIADKLSELAKSPGVVTSPLAMVNRDPLPDTIEVFKGNQAMGVFSLRHQLLADYVVGIPSKLSFPTRELFKVSLSRFGALALERCFKSISLFSNLIHRLSRIKLAITINGKVDNAEVNPQCPSGVIWGGLWGINSNRKIEDALVKQKVALFNHPVYSNRLVFSYPDRDKLPTRKGKDRYPVQPLEGKDTVIVNHSRVGLEANKFGLIPSVDFNHFPNTPDCHLSRQAIVFTKVAIGKMVEFHLRRGIAFKSKVRDIIAGFIELLHSLNKSLVLLFTGSKFYHQGLFHNSSIDLFNPLAKSLERRMGEFLCQLKQAVSFA